MQILLIIIFSFTFSAILKVPQEYKTIQEAINKSSSGDIIKISPGKYSPSTNKEKFPIQLKHKSNITIMGSQIDNTIIDAENSNRVMYLNYSKNINFENLTIKGGYLNSYGIKNHGGGLRLTNSNLSFKNIIISDNNAWVGGGISLNNSIAEFKNNVILKNNRGLKRGAATAMFGNSKLIGEFINVKNKVGIFDNMKHRENEIALVTKSRGRVNYKKYNSLFNQMGLKVGTDLFDKDTIKTGKDGFIIYIYLDDKSLIKVHNDTEIVINRNKSNEILANSVELNYGKIKVFIDPNKKKTFEIVTPTSVASVKGTEFWAIRNKFTQIDQFICQTGLLEVKNLFSGKSVLVDKMKTAISELSGVLIIKENEFVEIPEDEIINIDKVNEKRVLEIGKGDKTFLRILKYCSIIGAGLIIYSIVSLG